MDKTRIDQRAERSTSRARRSTQQYSSTQQYYELRVEQCSAVTSSKAQRGAVISNTKPYGTASYNRKSMEETSHSVCVVQCPSFWR